MARKKRGYAAIRLFFSLTVAFLIPVIALYFIYSFSITSMIRNAVVDIISTDMQASVNRIDSKIKNLENTVTFFQRGNGYQGYLERGFDNDLYGNSALTSIISDVYYIFILSEIADDFVVAIHDYDTMFAASGMHTTVNYLTNCFVTDEYSIEDQMNLIFNSRETEVIHLDNLKTNKGSGEHLVFVFPILQKTGEKKATAVFSVPIKNLTSLLPSKNLDFGVKTVVTGGEGNVIFSQNITKDETSEFLSQNRDDSAKIGNEEYTMLSCESDSTGWLYTYLIPKDNSLVNEAFKINRIFTIYLGSILIIGCALIYAFLHINYKPIRDLADMTRDIIKEEDETPNELKNIESAIRSLKNRVEADIEEIRKNRVFRLLNGNYSSLKEFNEDCEQIDISFVGDYFYVSIFQLDGGNSSKNLKCEAEIKEVFSDGGECQTLVSGDKIIVVHSSVLPDMPDIERFYTALGVLHDNHNLMAVAGIGRPHKGTETIDKSYIQAIESLEFRHIAGSGKVIHYNQVMEYYFQNGIYPSTELEKLKSSVNSLDFDEIVHGIDTIINILENSETSLLNAKSITFDVLKIFFSSKSITKNGSFRLQTMMSTLANESMRFNFVGMVRSIREDIGTILASTDSVNDEDKELLERMIVYIKENCCKPDFSVQKLSDEFKIGSGPAGRFFKEKMGIGLLEYVIELRMEKAKELLRSSNLAVKEISYEVGYYNVPSFIRRFKDHEGVTPNEYRFKS